MLRRQRQGCGPEWTSKVFTICHCAGPAAQKIGATLPTRVAMGLSWHFWPCRPNRRMRRHHRRRPATGPKTPGVASPAMARRKMPARLGPTGCHGSSAFWRQRRHRAVHPRRPHPRCRPARPAAAVPQQPGTASRSWLWAWVSHLPALRRWAVRPRTLCKRPFSSMPAARAILRAQPYRHLCHSAAAAPINLIHRGRAARSHRHQPIKPARPPASFRSPQAHQRRRPHRRPPMSLSTARHSPNRGQNHRPKYQAGRSRRDQSPRPERLCTLGHRTPGRSVPAERGAKGRVSSPTNRPHPPQIGRRRGPGPQPGLPPSPMG